VNNFSQATPLNLLLACKKHLAANRQRLGVQHGDTSRISKSAFQLVARGKA